MHVSGKIAQLVCAGALCASVTAWAQAPKMKMTTPVPEGVATPDRVETSIGTLTAFDGVPDEKSRQLVYDNLDRSRALQAYLAAIPIASMAGLRNGLVKFGPANTTVVQFDELMDSKAIWLTPNTTSVYMASWLQMTDEPWVIETPPNVLGIIDNYWFKYVTDFGNAGPDRGQGGKFLILPPGYEGAVPDGYHVARSTTYGNWVIWRGFQVNGSTKPAIEATQKILRMYPLSQASNPPKMNFINVSGVYSNTVHRMDYGIWEEINQVVQAEPAIGQNSEVLGLLASIGIEHGKPFNPDARMKTILADAADIGAYTARALAAKPRDKDFYFYPGESYWTTPFVGGSSEFLHDGATLLDGRTFFHFYATGITPAMAAKFIGRGSQYAAAYNDSTGKPLNGSNTYRITLPPDAPAKDFWSFTVYDNQTRSMLQTDQRFPGIDSNKKGLIKNKDGSFDIYFGPRAPAGKESNWIQTVPGKGFNALFRLYGPLQPWYDKTWRPGDFVLVK